MSEPPRKLILSLDGGGVRGRFEVEIINSIELALGKKIYEVFDLVVGVSAGAATAGVIATHNYTDLRNTVLDSKQAFERQQSMGPMLETKYDGTGKTSFLKKTFGNTTFGEVKYPIVVLTASINGNSKIFTSWNPDHQNLTLANVIDASTAAPIYFPPVKIQNEYYIDGGTVSNDPVLAGISMARAKWGEDVKLSVLSLGTGMTSDIKITETNHPRKFGLVKWLMEGLVDILTRSNDQLYIELIPLIIGHGNYFRVTSTVTGNLDDTSINMERALLNNATDIWNSYGSQLISWIKSKKNL
jgi:patatin-like phospholipase/acyl hydrolase